MAAGLSESADPARGEAWGSRGGLTFKGEQRGAGRALKGEFIVFIKENIGFLGSGELPGGPKTGGWAPSGVLDSASGRWLGGVGRVLGARGSVRGAPREVFGALGSSFRRSGDNFG